MGLFRVSRGPLHALSCISARSFGVRQGLSCFSISDGVRGLLLSLLGFHRASRGPLQEHLDPDTGWLSIDVINVLGQAQLGLHVDAAAAPWRGGLCTVQGGAALVNWNQRHWTVLQRDPSGDGWMHTNSVEGPGARHGRRRGLSVQAVEDVLADIAAHAGRVSLHAITGAQHDDGRHYLEAEGWRAMACAEREEVLEAAGAVPGHASASSASDSLSMVSCNVDGLGHYGHSSPARMKAILQHLLGVQPDVLALQEVTTDMFAQLQSDLPGWKLYRMRTVTEEYFNVIAARHGSERTTSFPFASSANGRHLITMRWRGWTVVNTHAESGSRDVERDARESQLLHMSRLHELEDGQVCVLAGDFNLRAGEEAPLEREGWRDAWSTSAAGAEDWTWCRASSHARYDRIFLHDAAPPGCRVECTHIQRLAALWPCFSDHVALHAVLRCRPSEGASVGRLGAHAAGGAAALHSATGHERRQAKAAATSGQEPDAESSSTGMTPAPLARGQGRPAASAPARALPVVLIGSAVVQCAMAVHRASVSEPGEATGGDDGGEMPKWSQVPKLCGFKTERFGGRGQQRWATAEQRTAQCQEYGRYIRWARESCGLTVPEFEALLQRAASTHQNLWGAAGLPSALQQSRWPDRITPRAHAVLLCRAAGLRKAAASGEVEGLGGAAEMERLLALGDQELQAECDAIPPHLRKAGSFDVLGVQVTTPDARVRAVVGLFRQWLIQAGARRLGAEAALEELLQAHGTDAEACPAACFPLDNAVFTTEEAMDALGGKFCDAEKLFKRGWARAAGAWCRLIWRLACVEVNTRFDVERRSLPLPMSSPAEGSEAPTFEFSMEVLYRELFQERESPERERRLDAVYLSLEEYTRRRHGSTLRGECDRLHGRNAGAGVGSFRMGTRLTLWKWATVAWQDGWPTARAAEGATDSDAEAPGITPLPKHAVKDLGDGLYKFRSHRAQAASFEEGWRLLDAAWAEEQSRTAHAQRAAKRAKRDTVSSVDHDASQRPGALHTLRPPSKAYHEVFHGRLAEDGDQATFIEEGTWLRATVDKRALHAIKHKGVRSRSLDEQLYFAMRGAHSQARQRQGAQRRQQAYSEQLPKAARDLEVKKKEPSGHLRYAYNGFEVLVTPRRHRQAQAGEGCVRQDSASLRELTPDRALRKLRDKIKRSLNKAARGEHEAILARAPLQDGGPSTTEHVAPALGQLDDPVALGHLRAGFAFLASVKLLHCHVCDEEWPVFEAAWPQAGARTAGALAGVLSCNLTEASFSQGSRMGHESALIEHS